MVRDKKVNIIEVSFSEVCSPEVYADEVTSSLYIYRGWLFPMGGHL